MSSDKSYKLLIAKTDEERTIGLSNHDSLPEDEGMLFILPEGTKETSFQTSDMSFDITIIAIDNEEEVIDSVLGKAGSEEIIDFSINDEDRYIKYILEVNPTDEFKKGDDIDVEDWLEDVSDDEISKMYVIGPNGEEVMDLAGGERIVSRIETKGLIQKAKKADKSKLDKDYKKLGLYLFNIFKKQDERPEEYVEA